jgi:hypothetical protein
MLMDIYTMVINILRILLMVENIIQGFTQFRWELYTLENTASTGEQRECLAGFYRG